MNTAKIIDIKLNERIFGLYEDTPQKHDWRVFFQSLNGAAVLNDISATKPHAIIKTDKGHEIYVWHTWAGFVSQLRMDDGTRIDIRVTLRNVASPYDILALVEEEIRYIKLSMISFGETRLAERRKAAGWTQQKLAEISGVSAVLIGKFETQERQLDNARYKTVIALTKALCCRPEDIV